MFTSPDGRPRDFEDPYYIFDALRQDKYDLSLAILVTLFTTSAGEMFAKKGLNPQDAAALLLQRVVQNLLPIEHDNLTVMVLRALQMVRKRPDKGAKELEGAIALWEKVPTWGSACAAKPMPKTLLWFFDELLMIWFRSLGTETAKTARAGLQEITWKLHGYKNSFGADDQIYEAVKRKTDHWKAEQFARVILELDEIRDALLRKAFRRIWIDKVGDDELRDMISKRLTSKLEA